MKKILLCIAIVIGFCYSIMAQGGANDPAFNTLDNLIIGNGTGFDGQVRTICIQPDGKILVGGSFATFNGISRKGILRLNNNSTLDTTFNIGSGFGISYTISTISIQSNGKIIVGGIFQSFNGIAKYCLLRLNSDGSLDNSFNIGNSNSTFDYVSTTSIQSDGKIIIGGKFSNINYETKNNIVRLNSNGSTDTSFHIGVGFDNSVVSTNILPNGKIIIGGAFLTYNYISKKGIVRLNIDGSMDTSFNSGTGFNNAAVSTISIQPDGKIIVGGYFNNYNGTAINTIARLNSNGSLDVNFNPGTGFNSNVTTICIKPDGKILVGGGFTLFNGTSNNYISCLNNDGSLDTTFSSGSGFHCSNYGTLSVIKVLSNGKIIAGGNFEYYNGTPRNYLAGLNNNGSLYVNFNPFSGLDKVVNFISVQTNDKIVLGGNFTTFNGILRNGIARMNSDGSLDTTFNPGKGFINNVSGNNVETLSIQSDGKIIVGGRFSSFNDIQRRGLARLNSDGSLDLGFNPGSTYNYNYIYSIKIQTDGKIIIAGDVSKQIQRLNNNGTPDASFNIGTGFNGEVITLCIQPDGKILAGGNFSSFNGIQRKNIVRLYSNGSLDTTFNTGLGFLAYYSNVLKSMSIQPDGKIIVGGNFYNYNGIALNGIARLNCNGTLDTTFNIGTGIETASFVGSVQSTSIQSDGKIIVGGEFNKYNGILRKNLIRLNINGSLDTTFNIGTGFNSYVMSTNIQSNGKIIVGGNFNIYNGAKRNRIIRLLNCNNITSSSHNILACNSYTFNTQTYTTSGTYTQTLVNAAGCDSIITLNLTITIPTTYTFSQTACNSFTLNGQTYTTSGTYTQTLTNAVGCDSVITLNLVITNPTTYTLSQTACNSYTLNGQTYTTSGTYTQTLTNAAGCDSTITLNLTIKNSTTKTLTASTCNSYTLNGQTYTTSGTYTQTLVNAAGCDSIITLNLTINKVTDISTSVSGVIITSNNNSASYQWFNCDNNFAPISGAMGQSFTASSNGNYAVQLTQNGCIDTSACVAITTVGITNPSTSESIHIYPNPAKENLIIELIESHFSQKTSISIYNIQGQLCRQIISNQPKNEIDIKDLSTGLYVVKVNNEQESFVSKFVKE